MDGEAPVWRVALRDLLKRQAFFLDKPDQPLVRPDGSTAPWMLYSWQVSLTRRGASLAALGLLEKLASFEAKQIASYGYTALPLLAACIMLGGGRYTGLCIREERKTYGTRHRIEGPADRQRPVVLVDDSLVSGETAMMAIEALESEGFQVEGCVVLVNFPWGTGRTRLLGLGYNVEYVFDVAVDLGMSLISVPSYQELLPRKWEDPPIANGLSPAAVARQVAERYIARGSVPFPPLRFDVDPDGRGGVFVSIRERETNFRLSREGFWHFRPEESEPCRDLILATVAAVDSLLISERGRLSDFKIAVTFFGSLEEITPAQLDFSTYGIVVRSPSGERAGGALPNTECYTSEVEQYRHARWINAQIAEHEPHQLYRHTVTKIVEPGEYWLPFGAPTMPRLRWTRDREVGETLVTRARELLVALDENRLPQGMPVPDELIPAPVYAVAVTLYHNGVVGNGLSWEHSLDACLHGAVVLAWTDKRLASRREGLLGRQVDVVVSVLHDQEIIGDVRADHAADKMRLGLDSLSIERPGQAAILLPLDAISANWTKEQSANELMKAAEIVEDSAEWAIYPTASWLQRKGSLHRLSFGVVDRGDLGPFDAARMEGNCRLMAEFICRHLEPSGIPEFEYRPVENVSISGGTAARRIAGLCALLEAGRVLRREDWHATANRGLSYCLDHVHVTAAGLGTLALPSVENDAMGDCMLLFAASRLADSPDGRDLAPQVYALAETVRSMVQTDGRIAAPSHSRWTDADHDFLPGCALLALATFTQVSRRLGAIETWPVILHWYRRRFRRCRSWGMVGWHPQAWKQIHALHTHPSIAGFIFEVADWALDFQHERSGAFICDLDSHGPSYMTAFLAEGIVAAAQMAARVGDLDRLKRYRRSCVEAMRFMDELLIREEDTFCMAAPEYAVGGVRLSRVQWSVGIDFLAHSLMANLGALKLRDLLDATTSV